MIDPTDEPNASPSLPELVTRLLAATIPFPSALEEMDPFGSVDLADLWQQLAAAVKYVRTEEEGGGPTTWNLKADDK